MKSLESYTCHTGPLGEVSKTLQRSVIMESCNTESSLDLPLESLSLQPFLQSLHKEQWQEVRLGEVAEMNNGKARPKNYGDYPIYGGNGILGYGNQYNCDSETIIVGRVGAYCGCVYYEKQPIWVSDNAIIVKAKSENNIKFLYYVLKSMNLNDYALGSSHPLLTQNLLNTLQVEIPKDITTQQKIAEILSSFDDKIDLLHRQNKTLESLALTLFRHYFIDNPNRNEWELGKLGDYVKIIDNRGKTPPFTTDITPYPLIEVNALSDDSMLINYDVVRKYVIKETYQNWFREHIKQYDILLSTVGSIGEVAMLLDNKGCIAQNVIGFRARDISPFYLYEWLKYMQQEIKEFDIGSVQPSIKITHFVEKQIYKPDSKTLESFDKQMLLITNKISHNAKQIQNLQAMRDMLLKAIFA
nr:restriction endonuclease subunit S [Helicobacter bilis]